MIRNKTLITALALMSLALAGCGGSQTTKPTAGVDDQSVKGATPGGAATQAGPEGEAAGANADATQEVKKQVYFAFDSSAIDDGDKAIVEANAKYLAANPQAKITLEGNTDERGTREYNLALGERRSQSVERMLKALGVASSRIVTVSYGQEKPVAPGHDESAWHLNRRVDFVYK